MLIKQVLFCLLATYIKKDFPESFEEHTGEFTTVFPETILDIETQCINSTGRRTIMAIKRKSNKKSDSSWVLEQKNK
jgi:hypothetical protein